MIEKLNTITIIGGPGTGKSTLAENFKKQFNIPVYHLDAINYKENWKARDKQERDKIILEKINEEKWIMDGTYRSTLEKRIEKSDLVIYLNYSTIARLKGILTRYFTSKEKERSDIPGCNEKMNLWFIKCTVNWKKSKGQFVQETLEKFPQKNILIFKNRKQLNKWYNNEFNKKIDVLC